MTEREKTIQLQDHVLQLLERKDYDKELQLNLCKQILFGDNSTITSAIMSIHEDIENKGLEI